MAQFVVEEHPEEAECFALQERGRSTGCNGFKLSGFDSEDKDRFTNLLFRFFHEENNPCSDIMKEEW